MKTSLNKVSFVFAAILLVLACVMCVFLTTGATEETTAAAAEFVAGTAAGDTTVIAQITDTHYYPQNYCYYGNYAGTDYEADQITSAKMVLESSAFNIAALDEIAALPVSELPDYLVVTGDLTRDGEIQAHLEMANLLRKLQNEVRTKGKTNFQVFVSVGNHDMYNTDGVQYRNGGTATSITHLTTRYDITKIYFALGFPDLDDNAFKAYLSTLPTGSDVFYDHLPYSASSNGGVEDSGYTYVMSHTASDVSIARMYEDVLYRVTPVSASDYENADLTYVARCNSSGYTFISIDEEISDDEIFHYVGGMMYESSKSFISSKATEFEGQTLVGIMHHNAIPHFDGEDSLLKDFTIYNWQESADYFADLGMTLMFTGHMHSNDIVSHVSFNGNLLTDIETASMTGYGGGTRYVKMVRGTVDGKYAENLSTKLDLIDEVDLSSFISEGYITESYLQNNNLMQFVEKTGTSFVCIDPSEYAETKLFLNIVDNVKYQYLSTDFIGGLGSMVKGMLDNLNITNAFLSGLIESFSPAIEQLVDNLVVHLEDVVLDDYTYAGSNASYKTGVRGAKLCGYLEDAVNALLDIKVNSQGTTLEDFALGSYLRHVYGNDMSAAALSAGDKEAFENLSNGSIVRQMIDILLDKETGLYRLIEGLTLPMNLATGLSADDIESIEGVLTLVRKEGEELRLSALVLDNVNVQLVLDMFSIDFSLGDQTIMEFLDGILDSYITSSFYSNLGEIASDILYAFCVDETAECELNTTEYEVYKYDSALAATYVSDKVTEAPSIENGKLPSMLTVTFGDDPKTDKNFVWYTDRRVDGTDIQYCAGTFDAATATKVAGTFEHIATTNRSIDLGIFATLRQVSIGYHNVELTGLTPGTTYSYRVGSSEDNLWSPVYEFTTAPDTDQAFELLLITDIQGSVSTPYETSVQVLNNIDSVFEDGYAFIINCGDVTDNSRNLVQWQYLLDTDQAVWANTTQIVTAGNHDKYEYEGVEDASDSYGLSTGAITTAYNYLLKHYDLSYPTQDDSQGAYYSFDYSGVHFTVLNTNDIDSEDKMSAAQITWLENDLKSTTKAFKVIIMHKGIFTSGAHSTDVDVVNMRAQLAPIFANNGVHLVLQGHDHTYSESYYLDANGEKISTSATGKSKIGDNGTLYVTLGTLGDKFYDYIENEDVPVEFGKELHNTTLSNPTFGKLTFDGKDLYYVGYEYDLETGKISELRGLEWWAYLLIAIACAAVVAGVAVAVVFAVKKKKLALSASEEVAEVAEAVAEEETQETDNAEAPADTATEEAQDAEDKKDDDAE